MAILTDAQDDVTLNDILEARESIQPYIRYTPCIESPLLSDRTHCEVWCKCEYTQRTGSFKERGARYALNRLSDAQRRRGAVAASAGNHALALAYHGKQLGIPVTVVMPIFAPLIKVQTCRELGANVELFGDTIADARGLAERLVSERDLTYIHGYDARDVIAGQGTVALEILEQAPQDIAAIVVPIGGGGLIAGMGAALKALRPDIELIGVEAENAASYAAALGAGKPVRVECRPTLADGLAVPQIGELAFRLARRAVDRAVSVSEDEIAMAVLRLLEQEKGVVEGAGATPLAALLGNKLPHLRGKKIVLTLCGGNVDALTLGRIIDKGMAADGRLCKFTAVISDRPGGLSEFTRIVASTGASIRDIFHDRAFAGADITEVQALCIVETRDYSHRNLLLNTLRESGIRLL